MCLVQGECTRELAKDTPHHDAKSDQDVVNPPSDNISAVEPTQQVRVCVCVCVCARARARESMES